MSTISSALSAQNVGNTAATPSTAKHGELDQQAFLKLLITQLQQQDPLKPTDSDSFIQQVTGFNQLDQLIKLVDIGEKQLKAQGVADGNSTGSTTIQPGAEWTPPEIKIPTTDDSSNS